MTVVRSSRRPMVRCRAASVRMSRRSGESGQPGEQVDRRRRHRPAAVRRRRSAGSPGRRRTARRPARPATPPGLPALSREKLSASRFRAGGRVDPAERPQPRQPLRDGPLVPDRAVGRVRLRRRRPARILRHQQAADLPGHRPGGRHHPGSGVVQQSGHQLRRQAQSRPADQGQRLDEDRFLVRHPGQHLPDDVRARPGVVRAPARSADRRRAARPAGRSAGQRPTAPRRPAARRPDPPASVRGAAARAARRGRRTGGRCPTVAATTRSDRVVAGHSPTSCPACDDARRPEPGRAPLARHVHHRAGGQRQQPPQVQVGRRARPPPLPSVSVKVQPRSS